MTPGRAHPAVGDGADDDEPMSKVLGLDARTSSFRAWLGFTAGGTSLLAALLVGANALAWMRARGREPAQPVEEIENRKRGGGPAGPFPRPVRTGQAGTGSAAPRASPRDPAHFSISAQAAKVLTQEPTPEEPVDLTGNAFVQGNAAAYAGGYSSSRGTSTRVVLGMPSPVGPSAGSKTAPSVAAPDRSRVASLSGEANWSCPFPPEADNVQVDDAYVTLQVDVDASGGPAAVRVLSDPGTGFGREARRCAMSRRYATALDRDGNPVVGTTRPFRVHFSR